jgi:hypothetical protein
MTRPPTATRIRTYRLGGPFEYCSQLLRWVSADFLVVWLLLDVGNSRPVRARKGHGQLEGGVGLPALWPEEVVLAGLASVLAHPPCEQADR